MRVCVTGGAGFIGSHLVDRLVAEGHGVTVLDDLSTGRRENLAGHGDRVDLVVGDVRDPAAVRRAVRGAEVVYHQAALASVPLSLERPLETHAVNVDGTLGVLVAARAAGARRVVFASSSSVYGESPELPKTESMALAPRSPYAASKAAGEAYVQAFSAAYGLEGVVLRYFNVYGPRQAADSPYAAVIPRFLEACLAGRAPVVFGDGGQTRDFAWVGDVVDALCLAATAPDAVRGPMNLGGGTRTSVLELARLVGDVAGAALPPRHEPARAGDVRDSLADIARAAAWLGWRPRTPLATGLARTIAAAQGPS